jgi:hypothetical protein
MYTFAKLDTLLCTVSPFNALALQKKAFALALELALARHIVSQPYTYIIYVYAYVYAYLCTVNMCVQYIYSI